MPEDRFSLVPAQMVNSAVLNGSAQTRKAAAKSFWPYSTAEVMLGKFCKFGNVHENLYLP